LSDPPLGVNATRSEIISFAHALFPGFQWAPTLGGECYDDGKVHLDEAEAYLFQWAPTLGGECYWNEPSAVDGRTDNRFQWAPTLGGECYTLDEVPANPALRRFQWAPTLGGECYPR